MALLSVTYTFANGTRTIANKINTNFSDFLAGIVDGSKNLKVAYSDSSDVSTPYTLVTGKTTTDTAEITGDTNFGDTVEAEDNTELHILATSETPQEIICNSAGSITPTQTNIWIKNLSYNNGDFSSIVISDGNKYLEITEQGSSTVTVVTITTGAYNGTTLAAKIQVDMNAALAKTYSVTYSAGVFTISSANTFTLWTTGGAYITRSIFPTIGIALNGYGGTGTDHTSPQYSSVTGTTYQIAYRHLSSIIDTSLEDGTILNFRLLPAASGGDYVPVTVYLDMFWQSEPITEIAIMLNSVLYVQIKKDGTSGTNVALLSYSHNHIENNY